MSIQSEITRITNKRDQALTKVASKGVTVPSGSTMDDLPDLIDLISVDETYSVTKTLTNVTTTVDDTKVIAGNSFFMDLTPDTGYAIRNITVTMGGVDITDQVFTPGVGKRTIVSNGTYTASTEGMSGYSSVTVNVSADLGTKNIAANGTYNAATDDLDGYSQVAVNVANSYTASDEGKVVSSGALVAQTSDTVTQNGTVDTTLINSLTVNVSSGITPTGSMTISSNGTYDVTAYAEAIVDIPSISKNEAYLDRHFSTEDFESARSFSVNGFRLGNSFAARSVRWLNATGGGMYTLQYFDSNSKVKYFVLPKVTDFSVDMFKSSTSLLGVEMSSVTTIRQTCFSGCTGFGLLVIRKNGVPTLSNISAFNNTKFASGKAGGILYVPQAQIANYQAATNWSTILGYSTNQILPIEGSIYETQYADGTPIA